MSSTAAPEPKNEQEVLGIYRQMNSELQSMVQSYTKFEMDRNEHRLVEETLEPMDPDRRAFRLVGGVLVERTIREVLPTVTENRKKLDDLIEQVKTQMETKLLSSGSDGLIKLWTIRTNECESTMDGHDDKIWALDLSRCGTALFSGGADSKITVWRDTTKEKDDAVRAAEEQNTVMEQKLSNHLRHKQYEEALEIALQLEKPHQVLRVLTDIVEKDTKSSRGIETLKEHVAKWSPDRLRQILKYCREWNTRARNSHIAMLVLKAVVTTIPATKLASHEGVTAILAGITPYAERHFDRLDRMVGDSYLLDFTLFSMGSLHGSNNEDYSKWTERSKYVLPPKEAEGKIQIGGSLIVGGKTNRVDNKGSSDDEDIVTIGDSDTDVSSDGS